MRTPFVKGQTHPLSGFLLFFSALWVLARPRIPSYSKAWLSLGSSPVRLRLGGGAAHVRQLRSNAAISEPARGSKQRAGLREMGPGRTSAFHDAAMIGFTSVVSRLIPSVASSAPGSPALLLRDTGMAPDQRRFG